MVGVQSGREMLDSLGTNRTGRDCEEAAAKAREDGDPVSRNGDRYAQAIS